MSSNTVHHALLRPAIVQILRGVGFHSARPSVIDSLTDICARYLMLLASRTAARASENHSDMIPDITDIRMAMGDSGLLTPTITASEEAWRELLRKPLHEIPERNGLRDMETSRRDEEDTNEVEAFIAWFHGDIHRNIKRIAGMGHEHKEADAQTGEATETDYLTALKKKHSKTGEESRFQGTVLGKSSESKPVKIEGGPGSITEWQKIMKEQQLVMQSKNQAAPEEEQDNSFASSDTVQALQNSADTIMEDSTSPVLDAPVDQVMVS